MLSLGTLFISIIDAIAIFRNFAVIFMQTQGEHPESTITLMWEVYQTACGYLRFGLGAAISVVLLLTILLLSVPMRLFQREDIQAMASLSPLKVSNVLSRSIVARDRRQRKQHEDAASWIGHRGAKSVAVGRDDGGLGDYHAARHLRVSIAAALFGARRRHLRTQGMRKGPI